jgi:hypothetical protein
VWFGVIDNVSSKVWDDGIWLIMIDEDPVWSCHLQHLTPGKRQSLAIQQLDND